MDRPVCFCNSNRAWGGGEKWHLEAALAMAGRGCRVFLTAGEGTELLERARQHPEIKTRAQRFSGPDFLNPMAVGSFAAFLRANRIQRVVLGLPADLKAGGLAAKLAGVPGIYYRRGSALPVRDTVFNRFLYGKLLTGLIVNSRETGRLVFAANKKIMDRARVHVLPNGFDVPAFDAALAGARPAFRDGSGKFVIGNAGRLTSQKGQHYLLHMSRALKNKGFAHTLVIAGDGERGDELKALASALDLGDTVLFTGFLRDMAPFWRGIDLFVLSSLWEGFGYVLAEAMLAEKPVIAFDGNSMPEIVRSGETGILTPMPGEGESDADVGARLAKTVLSLAADPAERARLAGNGRTYCRTTFDQEWCMDQLHALLWPEV